MFGQLCKYSGTEDTKEIFFHFSLSQAPTLFSGEAVYRYRRTVAALVIGGPWTNTYLTLYDPVPVRHGKLNQYFMKLGLWIKK